MMQDFTRLYHLHLEGNVRHNPKLSGTAYNVFGIQVGVGITIAIRCQRHQEHRLLLHRIEKYLRREKKLAWIAQHKYLKEIKWKNLQLDKKNNWLTPEHTDEFDRFVSLGCKDSKESRDETSKTIFKIYGRGVATCRDEFVYNSRRKDLVYCVQNLIENYNSEVDRFIRVGGKANLDDFVIYEKIKWSRDLKADLRRGRYAEFQEQKIRKALYRPFNHRYLFFDRILNEEVYVFPKIFPNLSAEQENIVMAVTDLGSEKPFMILTAKSITDLHLVGGGASAQCFPFYVYDEDGTNRRENITDWALKQYREHYGDKKITKWDIFYYVYGILHHPGYRERFAENLKRELPRIPLAVDFKAFFKAGKELAQLHLDYEKLEPWPLEWIEPPDVPLSYCVEDKMRLSKDKISLKVNDSLTLSGIPTDVFRYRLGNRSALDWVIDQYQVSEDNRSGIRSDPNQPDDPEYIVRLVGQVIRVSIETLKIIEAMPTELM